MLSVREDFESEFHDIEESGSAFVGVSNITVYCARRDNSFLVTVLQGEESETPILAEAVCPHCGDRIWI